MASKKKDKATEQGATVSQPHSCGGGCGGGCDHHCDTQPAPATPVDPELQKKIDELKAQVDPHVVKLRYMGYDGQAEYKLMKDNSELLRGSPVQETGVDVTLYRYLNFHFFFKKDAEEFLENVGKFEVEKRLGKGFFNATLERTET